MLEYDIKYLTNQTYIRQVMQAILDFEAEHGQGIKARVADKIGLSPEGAFAFSLNGALLGGLTFQVYNDWVFLEYGFVWPLYRRTGIYAELIGCIEQFARKAGLVGLHVWTYEWEAPAVYEALGFTSNGALRNFPRGNTLIHYIKEF